MIKLLEDERYVLKPVFETVFQSEVPDKEQANILAVVEDNKVVAFVTSEVLIRVGLVWVHPKRRGMKGMKAVRQLLRETARSIPKGASVIAIASEDRFKEICEKNGMREVEGAVFRLDF